MDSGGGAGVCVNFLGNTPTHGSNKFSSLLAPYRRNPLKPKNIMSARDPVRSMGIIVTIGIPKNRCNCTLSLSKSFENIDLFFLL